MGIPTFAGINTALSGLEISQAEINTTGNNIANASTQGYTEETVNAVESPGYNLSAFDQTGAQTSMGTGVDIESISRVRNQFLDTQYRAQNSLTGYANTETSELQNVQSLSTTSSTSGLQADMSSFWNAWSALATSPGSAAAQQSVVDTGQTLTTDFNNAYNQMTTVQQQASTQLSAVLDPTNGQVAQDANQISSLNSQIVQANASGQTPNQLLDQRDNLLDSLSNLAQIQVTQQNNGSVNVTFAGQSLISGATGTTVAVPAVSSISSSAGGQLGALANLASSTGPIGQMITSLNGVAQQVANAVNSNQPSASPFFSVSSDPTNPAGSISVVATAGTIAATSTGSSTPGDLAQTIANTSGADPGPDAAYQAFIGQVGDAVSGAEDNQTTQQAVLTGISNQRQSVSGVSLDQEMANLVNEQQAYQASARVMNTISTTISSLINTVGAGL